MSIGQLFNKKIMPEFFRCQNNFRVLCTNSSIRLVHIHKTEIFVSEKAFLLYHFLQSAVKSVYVISTQNIRMLGQNAFNFIPQRSDISVARLFDPFLNPSPDLINKIFYNSLSIYLIFAIKPEIAKHAPFFKQLNIPFAFKTFYCRFIVLIELVKLPPAEINKPVKSQSPVRRIFRIKIMKLCNTKSFFKAWAISACNRNSLCSTTQANLTFIIFRSYFCSSQTFFFWFSRESFKNPLNSVQGDE